MMSHIKFYQIQRDLIEYLIVRILFYCIAWEHCFVSSRPSRFRKLHLYLHVESVDNVCCPKCARRPNSPISKGEDDAKRLNFWGTPFFDKGNAIGCF